MDANTILYRISVIRTDGSVGDVEIYASSEAAAKAVVADHYPFTILGAEQVQA